MILAFIHCIELFTIVSGVIDAVLLLTTHRYGIDILLKINTFVLFELYLQNEQSHSFLLII